jgi:hypothetical protein
MKWLMMVAIWILVMPCALAEVRLQRQGVFEVYLGEDVVERLEITSDASGTLVVYERVHPLFSYTGPAEDIVTEYKDQYRQEVVNTLVKTILVEESRAASIEHRFTPRALGTHFLPPIYIEAEDRVYEFEGVQVSVKCIPDGVCEGQENIYNCPEDCSTGSHDGICDMAADGICDPDCIYGDMDCSSYCGDGTCDEAKETPFTCPLDCGEAKKGRDIQYFLLEFAQGSGPSVGLERGRYYDQEEVEHFLLLILKDRLGNQVSVHKKGFSGALEFSFKVPFSPIAHTIEAYDGELLLWSIDVSDYADYCGDGRCLEGESNLLCPADCSADMSDNYCSGLKDGVCDVDCPPGKDPDCRHGVPLWAILGGLFALGSIGGLWVRARRK